jgi:hypothetical protein
MRVNTTIPGCQLNLHRHRELLDHQTLFRKCQQSGPCWWANVQVLKDWKLTKTEPFQAAILLFGLGTYMVCSNSQVGEHKSFFSLVEVSQWWQGRRGRQIGQLSCCSGLVWRVGREDISWRERDSYLYFVKGAGKCWAFFLGIPQFSVTMYQGSVRTEKNCTKAALLL